MGYINFKEEVFVAKKQLKKRKHNNNSIISNLGKKKELGENYNPCTKYSYKIFNDEVFGQNSILDEEKFIKIQNKDIVGSKFSNCNFFNITFKECRFIGCIFENCEFGKGGVTFENCSFLKEDSSKSPSLNKYENLSCTFLNCCIYSKFLNCILSFAIFEDCYIKDTNFEQTDMTNIIISKCDLKMIIISDCDLCGCKIVSTYIEDLEFKDKFKSKLDEKSFIDKIPIRYKTREEYEGLYMVYETIADKFKENTLNNNFGEYYYLCKCMQRKTLKFFPKVESYIYFLTCGYGERPEFAVYSSLVIIIFFAFVYLIVGIEIDNKEIIYNINTISKLNFFKFINDFNESLTLSVGAFGGLGTINCKPVTSSYIFLDIEILIGIVMMGLGIGTLTRKVVR
ncbi:MAG: pentapeptide repeat-containing protein [Paeniclostridium sp.]|nr:pentapeptide repeat-containing protein [Paeniclostridium sp.]MBW4863175.1 pentapeptide repeat-containing protein [Paeniclostridium sp.]MBW4873327.1 pentapeptide repeat-containing protein [Paeniclostridium sp.]